MVDIERGMHDGDSVIVEELADELIDHTPGNLVFRIKQAPHPTFVRQGDNLHTTVTISLKDALVGFETEIEHIDGHKVAIARKEVTIPDQVAVIAGEGMPIKGTSSFGDLHVKFFIAFPAHIKTPSRETLSRSTSPLAQYYIFGILIPLLRLFVVLY